MGEHEELDDAVAIVGMAGRYPGARDHRELWRNLIDGVESVRRLDDTELDRLGVPAEVRADPDYVPVAAFLADPELFDAEFFGVSPRDAESMDPQHRVFLECAWEAMEDAGYGAGHPGRVGVYAGTTISSYLLFNIAPHHLAGHRGSLLNEFGIGVNNAADFLATRVAYKLNLTGPGMTVGTGCSSSLVAVHQAAQALLLNECDLALAGGVSIQVNNRAGYLATSDGIASPDGRCRPFDAAANGTVFGSGAGIVVLKRFVDAVADGDEITAVIRGSAINNDGSHKAGFTAPSVDGQARVIVQALSVAGVDAATIGYVEAHGTATDLGDSIELRALTKAFRTRTDGSGACVLGAVKGNVGHLDAAAGVTGLIKAALSLRHGRIPGTLHFTGPGPHLALSESPFRVEAGTVDWPAGAEPRRAGVSSFGIGGTNAHVVLEEAPGTSRPTRVPGRQVLLVSAKSPTAADEAMDRLRRHLAEHPDTDLADVAFTLQTGREAFEHRRYAVVDTATELTGGGRAAGKDPGVAFMFAGMGPHHVGMAAGLYRSEAVFRERFDQCAHLLAEVTGTDIAEALFGGDDDRARRLLGEPEHSLPTMFAVQYSLAHLFIAKGVEPKAVIGHSVGEYAAASVAGVFTVADALAVVRLRGKLLAGLPTGSMLNVGMPEAELVDLLDERVSLAAVNGPAACVVSGPETAIADLVADLTRRGVASWELPFPAAAHSSLVDPVLPVFGEFVTSLRLRPPRIPLVSTARGAVVGDEVTTPEYWTRHLRHTVRFHDGVRTVRELAGVLLEVGPGQSLTGMARRTLGEDGVVVPAMRHPRNDDTDERVLAAAAGQLWAAGVAVDWSRWSAPGRRRVSLPGYPFQRERFWIDPPQTAHVAEPRATTGDTEPVPVTAVPGNGVQDQVVAILAKVSGRSPDQLDPTANFFTIGLESLALVEAGSAINQVFGVRIPIRRMFQQLPNIEALSQHIHDNLPADHPAGAAAPPPPAPTPPAADSAVERLAAKQLEVMAQLMTEQLRALTADDNGRPATAKATAPTAFVPFRPTQLAADPLTPGQRAHVAALVARYNAKTAGSKERTARSRVVRANHRNVLNFRPTWKELVYPIFATGGAGARIQDVDGNEYVDLAMSFGATMLGHAPRFVTEAVQRELTSGQGMLVGPCTPHAEPVARLVSQLTGVERVAFFNSGTEAVMLALRLARAVTGRSKIAIFANSFHGTYDATLVNRDLLDPDVVTPICAGLTTGITDDVLVLDYCAPEALAAVREHGHELAAVLVEPVQSRNPSVTPGPFLRDLRTATAATGTALVFDETITGFRLHPGGAQALFDVRADLATYGKVVGGGMPIGIVSGSAQFMDAIDGGAWSFGDDSMPPNEDRRTFLGGTFCEHPLAMTAARAVLEHLVREGPALQRALNEKSDQLAARLRGVFAAEEAPIELANFGSIFRLRVPGHLELLYYHLLERGVYFWEGRTWFLSTAHSEDDLDHVVEAFEDSLAELRAGGFLPPKQHDVVLPPTDDQRQMWFHAQLDEGSACVYNESARLRLTGAIDPDAVTSALHALVDRHEALRTSFTPDGEGRRVAGRSSVDVIEVRCPDQHVADPERWLTDWWTDRLRAPFDLEQAPLLRAYLIDYHDDRHDVVVVAHHLALDGWSWSVALQELAQLYLAAVGVETPDLPDPVGFGEFQRWQSARLAGPEAAAATEHWRRELAEPPAPLGLVPSDPGPAGTPRRGGRVQALLDPGLQERLAAASREHECTLPMLLMAAFQALVHGVTGRTDFVCDVPVAGQLSMGAPNLVGHCTNLLPVRATLDPAERFTELLGRVKARLSAAYEHQAVPVTGLVTRGDLTAPRAAVLFNVDRRVGLPRIPGLGVEIESGPVLFARHLLSCNAIEIDGRLRVDLDFDAEIVDRLVAQAWFTAFEVLLRGVVADPTTPVGALPLVDDRPGERLAGLAEVVAPWRPGALAARPEAPAMRTAAGVETVGAFDARTDRLARRLLALAPAGAVLGVNLPAGPDLVACVVAAFKAGHTVHLPVDGVEGPAVDLVLTELPEPDGRSAEHVGEFVEPAWLVGVAEDGREVRPAGAPRPEPEGWSAGHPGESVEPGWLVGGVEDGQEVWSSGVELPEREGSSAGHAGEFVEPAWLVGVAEDGQEVWSSGVELPEPEVSSVGHAGESAELGRLDGVAEDGREVRPAGAELSAGHPGAVVEPAWLVGVAEDGQEVRLSGAALAEHLARLAHMLGLRAGGSLAVRTSDRAVLVERALLVLGLGGELVLDDLAGAAPDVLDLPANHTGETGDIVVTGAPMAAADLRAAGGHRNAVRLPGLAVTVAVGPTDGHQFLAAASPLWTGDVVDGRVLPVGVVGSLAVHIGDQVVGVADRRVRRTSGGAVEFVGPAEREVPVGRSLAPMDVVETALRSVPGVAWAAVRADVAGLAGYLVPDVGAVEDDWAGHCRDVLTAVLPADWMPAGFVVLDEPPAATTTLPPLTLAEPEPAGEVDERLRELWSDLFDHPVDQGGDFFELGGTSLTATRLATRIRHEFGVRLTLAELFQRPTLAGIAELLASATTVEDDPGPRRRPRDAEHYPLSLAQQRLWFVDRMGANESYVVFVAARLRGALDAAALRRCLDHIVARHEVLRTTLHEIDGEPVQVIGAGFPVPFEVVDLTDEPAATRFDRVLDHCRAEATRPFDLADGPLLRAGLLRMANDDHVVVLSMHHVVSDAWSLDILLREVTTLYEAELRGERPSLPELPVQYLDYALWQREWLAGPEYRQQLAHWVRELSGAPFWLELPTDRPRPVVQTFVGAAQHVTLTGDLTERLRRFTRARKVSLFSTMLAGFHALMALYSRQDEVLVGVPSANRRRMEIEPLIGFFVNMLVIRAAPAAHDTFESLVDAVQDKVLTADAHQEVPFDQLVEALLDERDTSRSPLFQVMFVLNEIPPVRRTANVELSPLRVERAQSRFDITLLVEDNGKDLVAIFDYNTDLFERATIERMAQRYTAFLTNALEDWA